MRNAEFLSWKITQKDMIFKLDKNRYSLLTFIFKINGRLSYLNCNVPLYQITKKDYVIGKVSIGKI